MTTSPTTLVPNAPPPAEGVSTVSAPVRRSASTTNTVPASLTVAQPVTGENPAARVDDLAASAVTAGSGHAVTAARRPTAPVVTPLRPSPQRSTGPGVAATSDGTVRSGSPGQRTAPSTSAPIPSSADGARTRAAPASSRAGQAFDPPVTGSSLTIQTSLLLLTVVGITALGLCGIALGAGYRGRRR